MLALLREVLSIELGAFWVCMWFGAILIGAGAGAAATEDASRVGVVQMSVLGDKEEEEEEEAAL